MRKRITHLFMLLFLCTSVTITAQTYTIGNVSWANIVDNDGDGYSQKRTLNIPITNSGGNVSALLEIRAWPDGTSEALYGYTSTFAVFGGNTSVTYTVDIGKNSSIGGELSRGTYDFRVLLKTSQVGSVLAMKSSSEDGDLNNENFETASEDAQATPTISIVTTSLNFGDVTVNNSSSQQTYTVNGDNLTSSLIITAPTGFQISTSANTGYSGSLSLPHTNGSVTASIYVRFMPTLEQAYSGNITHTSIGATTKNVSVSGNGVPPAPTVGSISATLKNIDNTSVPLPSSNGKVIIYNSSGTATSGTTNSNGLAVFSNQNYGTFTVEGYHTPNNPTTIFGEEYWGATSINHNGSNTDVNLIRNTPYDYEIRVFNTLNSQDVTGQNVPIGTVLRFQVKIKNPGASTQTVKTRLVVDRDKTSSYEYDQTSSGSSVNGNNSETTLILSETFTATQSGDYYGIASTQTYVNNTYKNTNGSPWGSNKLFGVDAASATYTIGNVSWANIVDNDGDGYSQKRTLNIPITNSGENVTALLEIRTWPDGTSEALYGHTSTFAVFGGNTSVTYTVDVGKNSSIGGELSRNTYDFRILLKTSQAGSILATKSSSDDGDLNNENFEIASEDALATPTISNVTTSLNFGNVTVNTSSSQQTYTVNGDNLTSSIIITAPTGFQISTSANTGYSGSLSLPHTNGSVTTSIYVRFMPTLTQAYSGDLTHTSTGATTKNVSVSGTGTPPPSNSVEVRLPSISGALGSQTNVPITVSDLTGKNITSYQMTIYYDKTITYLTGVDITGCLTSSTPTVNPDTLNGKLTIAWASASSLSSSGTLLKIKVKFRGLGNSTLTTVGSNGQSFIFNSGNPSATITSGQITTTPEVFKGDVDGNTTIGAYDASLVLQHVVGLLELSSSQILAADVDGNGVIMASDAAAILNYFVFDKWPWQ